MSVKTLGLPDPLREYLLETFVQEPDLLRRLREETALLSNAKMQISPEQGRFMATMLKLMGASHAIELGTFTGYSSVCIAQALPKEGTLVACDTSVEWTEIAQKYWKEARIDHKIDLRIGPALSTLENLAAGKRQFDFAFIDADKEHYIDYFERLLPMIRRGGLVAIDNVFWSGRVADLNERESETNAIRAFNSFLKSDKRVEICVVPIGDGLSLARKL